MKSVQFTVYNLQLKDKSELTVDRGREDSENPVYS